MIFTLQQRQSAYKKLSPEVQDFIMSNETTELIDNFLKEAGLSEEQAILADSEILYAMFGLQTLSDAITSIANLINKNTNDLSELKLNLEKNIFNNIPQSTEKTEEPSNFAEATPDKKEPPTQSGVGNSFEQIILNQAKAMRPAIADSSKQQVVSSKVPENLPAENSEPKAIHNYIGESDPYREPIE